MKFSIIIATKNREEILLKTLKRLDKQHFPKQSFEILIINNDPTDRLAQLRKISEKRSNLRILVEEKQGPSYARNLGIKNAKFEHLIFIDDDCFTEPDFLSKYEKAWIKNPNAKIIGGRIIAALNDKAFSAVQKKLVEKWSWCFAQLDLGNKEKILIRGEQVFSANLSYHKSLNERSVFTTKLGISLSDGRLLGGEDCELCARQILSKKTVLYDPSLVVINIVSESRFDPKYIRQRLFLSGIEMFIMDSELNRRFPNCGSKYKEAWKNAVLNVLRFDFKDFSEYFLNLNSLLKIYSYFFLGRKYLSGDLG